MAAKKSPVPGRKRGRPRKDPTAERTMPKAPKASKGSKKRGRPSEVKLSPEELKLIPQSIRDAVDRGDVSAKEVLDEILTKYAVLRDAMAKRAEVSKECRERTKQEWAALQGAMELPLRSDADVGQLRGKLESCEMRWQEYVEALQQNKLETRQASKDMRAAQKDLDQAIAGHAQLKLPFDKSVAEDSCQTQPFSDEDDEDEDEDDE